MPETCDVPTVADVWIKISVGNISNASGHRVSDWVANRDSHVIWVYPVCRRDSLDEKQPATDLEGLPISPIASVKSDIV
jgi:hypothetical protein